MNTPTAPQETRPRDGDVIIVRHNMRWEVGVVAGPPSLVWTRYDDAVAFTRRFAKAARIDIWVAGDAGTHERIVRNRLPQRAPRRTHVFSS